MLSLASSNSKISLNMQNTRPALPRLRAPLVGIIIYGVNVGVVQQ